MPLLKQIYYILALANFVANTPLLAQNRISVIGTVADVDGKLLFDAELSLVRQNSVATTNRFGEFDLGKIFPDDTVIVKSSGYQSGSAKPAPDMKFILYPVFEIQEQIRNARNGETITVPSGEHYFYPDFKTDSTTGLHIKNKKDLTIRGEPGAEIWLNWLGADLFRISGSRNILLENIVLGHYNPDNQPCSTNTILIDNSEEIKINNCNIKGSGRVGIRARNSDAILIDNSQIHDNKDFALSFNDCNLVSIRANLIADNGEIMESQNSQVKMIDNTFKVQGYFVPEFIFVEGGSIELLDESIIPPPPVQQLSAGDMYVSKTEVTFVEYDGFCEATGSEKPDDSEWGRGDNPVINISIEDAGAYCSWLGELLGKNIRLPNSKEWEYAARGGKKGGDDNQFSGSNIIEEVAWCKFNSNNRIQSVAQKKPNELGIYDMTGNVYEFCSDRMDSLLVLKGGSWINDGVGCRVADHVVSEVDFWDDNIGFRCFQDK